MFSIFRRSVALRFAMLLSAVIVVCLSILVFIQIKNFQISMRDEFGASNIVKTQLLATQVAGGIKWKKAEVVEAVYTDVVGNEASGFVSAYVFHTDDGKLSVVNSSEFDPFDFDGFLTEHNNLNKAAEIQSFDLPGHMVVYAPAIDTKKQEYMGGLLVSWSKETINREMNEARSTQMSTAFFILAALISLCVFLLRSMIITPLKKSIQVMTVLSEGDYNIEIPDLKRRDEIGTMARAIEIFKKNAIEKQAAEKAKIEAESRMESERKKAMQDMAQKFEDEVMGIVQQLLKSISTIGEGSKTLSSIAQQTERKSTDAAGFSGSTSQNVQTVAAASEELNSSVKEIVQQVSRSAHLTQSASEQAAKTNEIVGTLQSSTERIGAVVKIIQDIAEQTNLLALNATIEAARAGDAGKGFAVVANEVKSLANETAKATEEISERVQEIQIISDQSGTAIQSIADVIRQANESMSAVTDAIEQQGIATQEISRSVQEAAAGTSRVSESISSVNQAALETGKLVKDTSNALDNLLEQSDLLKSAINQFIRNIAA